MSLVRCTNDICNEGEGGVLAYVGTPHRSTEVEYLERHAFDTAAAVSTEIIETRLEISHAFGKDEA